MELIQVILLIWTMFFRSYTATPTPVVPPYEISPLMRQVELKKSLLYYNKAPLDHHRSDNQQRKSSDKSQTPGQDRFFIKPYKFPFWGLPYGIYSKGPGFPPYDGVFGSPWGPGQFPGYASNPFTQPGGPPQPPQPAPTAAPSPPTPSYSSSSGDDSYEYYYVKKKPKKRKPPPPKYKYPSSSCSCPYDDDDSGGDDSDCACKPPKEVVAKPKPRPSRPYRKPKKESSSSYQRRPSYNKRPCKYGYRSGPSGGCRPPPSPPKEDPDCGKRYRGKCPKPMTKPAPEPYAEDEEYESEEHYGYETSGDDDDEDAEIETHKVVPQYIPVYVPYPPHGGGGWGQDPPTSSGDSSHSSSPLTMQYQAMSQPPQQYQYTVPTPVEYSPHYSLPSKPEMTSYPNSPQPPQQPSPADSVEPQQLTIQYTALPPGGTSPQQQPNVFQYTLQPPVSSPSQSTGRSASPYTIQYTAHPLPEPQQPTTYANNNDNKDLATSSSSTFMNTFSVPLPPQIQLPFNVFLNQQHPSAFSNLFNPQMLHRYQIPLPQVASTTSAPMKAEQNLLAINAADPFIANHLNNYTASSLQNNKAISSEKDKTVKNEGAEKTIVSVLTSVSESK
ncbi:hypothetical protein Fcan01_23540 [Folsomia candida]|uniref:Uncharacterized protein n=2 Tax=Folsomia candida TaxID=158441 RepID=A0A226D9W6_FOLCA|nr:hypothetical protein Fcan01_23540 [Folsomia candida]